MLPSSFQTVLSLSVVRRRRFFSVLCAFAVELISDRDTEAESKVEEPGCKRGLLEPEDTARVASWDNVGPCLDTEAPWDNQRMHNPRVPGASRKRRTWAPRDNWPSGCAGPRKGSSLSAACAGRGNSRST